MNYLQFVAEATDSSNGNIATALGIDWRLLVMQIAAFLLLVWLLGKYVYPWLMKSVDTRQKNVEEAARSARIAQEAASRAKSDTEKLLTQAKKEASAIVETAKQEASTIVSTSEQRARGIAEQITSDAHDQLEKDLVKARDELHDETLRLVELATEKVVRETHTKQADDALIEKALKEVSK